MSGGEATVQVPAEETTVQVSGGETTAQVSAEEATRQVSEGETTAQVSAEETTTQVSEGEATMQVPAEETTVQVSEGEATLQVPAEETTAQVTEGELAVPPMVEGTVQVPSVEITVHVSAEEAPVIEAERGDTETEGASTVQVSEETSQEASLLGTTEEDVSPQLVEGTGTGTHGTATTQVTKAGEAWIDTLVRNIVTEVTAEGSGECQVHVSAASSIEQTEEEGGHSCAGTATIPDHEQVTLEETGAAVPVTHVQDQVSYDITVQEDGEVTGSLGQPGETGNPDQVGLSGTEGVAESLLEQEAAAEVEAGRPVKPPGEEAQGSVTPNLMTVPGREGTPDPGQPAACWEKEWPPLICTGSEVRADTAEQRSTDQGTVPEQEPCPGAPDMKDREMIENGVILSPETPIEREIRLTMEREKTLRQERGIRVTLGESELVEVRRKTVTTEPAGLPGKERQLAGAQMQREIQLETQRETDLVQQGKVMGTYDRGAQQELQERKMMFESMNTESSDPPFKRRQSEMRKSASIEALVEVPVPSNHVAPVAPASEFKKGPSYAEANGSNIIIIEHASILRKSAPSNSFSAAPADLRKTSPAESRRSTPADLRFTRPSSGNAPLPNSETPVAAPGSPFQLHRSPSPRSLLDREIEEVQQREKELRKQRTSVYGRDNGTAENSQITPNNQRDIQSGVYQPERPNWGKLEVNWPPNKSMTVNGQQDQALGSPRTRRQRNTLIKSWESGSPNPADDNN
ncbi:PREDICTED: cell wall adhesin EAP1 [Nanorana parkeri]|uniref:cell wall adhesin EAP1 n=1 Tax=Nanorana parkeri TaxID=125878 RepID=UPI0008542F67|nr:PREDICTED: cell wall adhesin EAP1 [Nanorana parkeri]